MNDAHQEMVKRLAYKYDIPEKDVLDAVLASDDIYKQALKTDWQSDELSRKDEAVREMIYSHLSKNKEDNGVYIDVYTSTDEHHCKKIGIRSLEGIAMDLEYRIGKINLVPIDHTFAFEPSFSYYEGVDKYVGRAYIPADEIDDVKFNSIVSYGGSEGIYGDVNISFRDKETNKRIEFPLVTVKTLDVSLESYMLMGQLMNYGTLLAQGEWSIKGVDKYLAALHDTFTNRSKTEKAIEI